MASTQLDPIELSRIGTGADRTFRDSVLRQVDSRDEGEEKLVINPIQLNRVDTSNEDRDGTTTTSSNKGKKEMTVDLKESCRKNTSYNRSEGDKTSINGEEKKMAAFDLVRVSHNRTSKKFSLNTATRNNKNKKVVEKTCKDVDSKFGKKRIGRKLPPSTEIPTKEDDIDLMKNVYQISIRKSWARRQRSIMKRQSATLIQKYYRVLRAKTQIQRMKYDRVVRAILIYGRVIQFVIIIQSCWRRSLAVNSATTMRKIHNTTIPKLQSHARRLLCKKLINAKKNAIVTIQKFYRGHEAKLNYEMTLSNILMIQRMYQRFVMNAIEKKRKLLFRSSIRKEQALIRGHLVRQKQRRMKKVAGILRRKQQRVMNKFIIIQKILRGNIARKNYRKELSSIISIQRMHRHVVMKVEGKKERIMILNNVMKLQVYARGILARNQQRRMEEVSVILQSNIRGFFVRREFNDSKKAIVTLQKTIRGHQARQRYLKDMKERKKMRSIISIQSFIRAQFDERKFKETKKRILLIQNFVRFQIKKKQSVISLQSLIRSYIHKNKFKGTKKCIILVQKQARLRQAKFLIERVKYEKVIESLKIFKKVLDATFIIQSRWRKGLVTSMREKSTMTIEKSGTIEEEEEREATTSLHEKALLEDEKNNNTIDDTDINADLNDDEEQQDEQQEIMEEKEEEKDEKEIPPTKMVSFDKSKGVEGFCNEYDRFYSNDENDYWIQENGNKKLPIVGVVGKSISNYNNSAVVQCLSNETNTSIINIEVTYGGNVEIHEDFIYQCAC